MWTIFHDFIVCFVNILVISPKNIYMPNCPFNHIPDGSQIFLKTILTSLALTLVIMFVPPTEKKLHQMKKSLGIKMFFYSTCTV